MLHERLEGTKVTDMHRVRSERVACCRLVDSACLLDHQLIRLTKITTMEVHNTIVVARRKACRI